MSNTATITVEPLDQTAPRRRLWSRADYYKMAEAGILGPDDRVELLEGEIIVMAPIGPEHRHTTLGIFKTMFKEFEEALGDEFYVMAESPIVLNDRSEPQPDVAVVSGTEAVYTHRHPTASEVALVVEVADSTLSYARGGKLLSYARSGITEYWVVNLVAKQLEVHRAPSDTGYADIATYGPNDVVSPLCAPNKPLAVSKLMR